MARIRSVKPEFWDDRKLAKRVSRDGRLLYIGMWNQADEHGRLNGDPQWLRGQIFAYDDDIDAARVAELVAELAAPAVGCVVPYEYDGDPFLFLPKLARHQRLEPNKVASRLPPPPGESGSPESAHDPDESARRADEPALSYGAGSMEQGAGSMCAADAAPARARATRIPDDFAVTSDLARWAADQNLGVDLQLETAKFIDYFRGASGQRATKQDWPATWRNWIRRAAERQPARASPRGRQAETDQIFDDALTRARARDAQEASDDTRGNRLADPVRKGLLPAAGDRPVHP